MVRLWMISALTLSAFCVVSLSAPRTFAKGTATGTQTFRISGGELRHPIVVTVPEALIATAIEGTWYTTPNGMPEPSPGSPRYLVEVVDPRNNDAVIGPAKTYVIGAPPRLSAQDGPGWGEPTPAIAALLDRYIVIGASGALSEHPTFAEVLRASGDALPSTVRVGDVTVSSAVAATVVTQIGEATPSAFGVQGTLVGQRNLHPVGLEIAFGDSESDNLQFTYVPPGPVAPYGLLFNPREAGNWGLVTMLDPWGYFATVYQVSPAFDALMASMGYSGAPEGDIAMNHLVPLDRAQLSFGIDHYEVSRPGGSPVAVDPPAESDPSIQCADASCTRTAPQGPFAGPSLQVEMWPLAVDPFPEAVRAAEFTYYAHDAQGSERGVLVMTQPGYELNGTNGAEEPYFATPALDAALKDQLNRIDRPASSHRLARTLGAGIPAVLFGVFAIAYVSWSAEKRRRRTFRDGH
jgi:hypothetical protein